MNLPENIDLSKSAITYSSYLEIEKLLQLQKPLSVGPEHDEMLFIIIHQTYELWFKCILHELGLAQDLLDKGVTHNSAAVLTRVRTILKVLVSQIDILETMTPSQFNSFRQRLEAASGFQSVQFRVLEAIFGRRDKSATEHLTGSSRARVSEAMSRPCVWDSVLTYLSKHNYNISQEILNRDFSAIYTPNTEVQQTLIEVYRNDPESAALLERLVDIDEGLQEWRYRHVKMVERTIGMKPGTGGSSGAKYLAGTLFNPVFPDLWAIRSRF